MPVSLNCRKRKAAMKKLPSEDFEQMHFLSNFKKTYPGVLIHSIPNGGKREKITASKLKLTGVVAGIPDLFIPEWGLWIEMKRKQGGVLSAAQKEIISELERVGYTVLIGYGCEDALGKVKQHLYSPQ